MAQKTKVVDPKGVTHTFVPNPTLNAKSWTLEYPPIKSKAKYLRSIHTGNLFPNTPEFAQRSDTMEPWFGNIEDYPDGEAPSIPTNPMDLAKDGMVPLGEQLVAL